VGERHRRDKVGARTSDEVRASWRCIFDDPGARPSHATQGEAVGYLKDFCHWLEVVL
jgi:hypothetical protein